MAICNGIVNQKSNNNASVIFDNKKSDCDSDELLKLDIDRYVQAKRISVPQIKKDFSTTVFVNCAKNDCRYKGPIAIFVPYGLTSGAVGITEVRMAVAGAAVREVAVKDAITTILAYVEQQMPKLMVGQLLVEAVNPNQAMSEIKAKNKARSLANDIFASLKKNPQGPWDNEKCAMLQALINTFDKLIDEKFLSGDVAALTLLNNVYADLTMLKDRVCK